MTDTFWTVLFIIVPTLAVLIALFIMAEFITDKVGKESIKAEREKHNE